MGPKGDDASGPLRGGRLTYELADQVGVPPMHAIEYADGQHRVAV